MKSSSKLFVLGGLLVAIALALLASPFASSSPDGLSKVAIDQGFDDRAKEHALEDGPLAGYGIRGVDNERMSKGLSGLIGVLVTFGVGMLLFGVLRATRARRATSTGG
ncbi:MAG: PDGLE domain-containing protein [Actinomycetota bacterium]|nr:PDGLE domain-containing protein [Actinomycetota bacterium]